MAHSQHSQPLIHRSTGKPRWGHQWWPVARCKVVSFSLKLTFSPLKNDGFPMPESPFRLQGCIFRCELLVSRRVKIPGTESTEVGRIKVNTSWRLRRSRRQKRKRKNHLIVCWPTGWWRNTPPQKKHLLNIKMDLYIWKKRSFLLNIIGTYQVHPKPFQDFFLADFCWFLNNRRSIIFLWISVQLVTFLPIERSRNQRRPTGWVGLGTCGCSLFEKSRLQYQGNSRPRLWW